jgi:hypothetical protein
MRVEAVSQCEFFQGLHISFPHVVQLIGVHC